MSANVSGFGQTMRITLNDNLLRRGSPEEIQEVMGHEMGHYVLNHIYKDLLLFFPIVILAGFAWLQLVAGLVPEALGRQVADSRHWRYRDSSAGNPGVIHLRLCHDARLEHAHPG